MEISKLTKCENKQETDLTCFELYDCCDCAGNSCGCRYCFSCNACEYCLGIESEG